MEKLLENSRKWLMVRIRTRPTAFLHQCGPSPAPQVSPRAPGGADGGGGWPWNSAGEEGCKGGIQCLLPTPPSSKDPRQPTAQGCLVSFRQAHAQEQLSGGAEGRDGAPGALLPWLGAAAHTLSSHWPCLNFSIYKLVCRY